MNSIKLTEFWLKSRRVNSVGEVSAAPFVSEIPFAQTKSVKLTAVEMKDIQC